MESVSDALAETDSDDLELLKQMKTNDKEIYSIGTQDGDYLGTFAVEYEDGKLEDFTRYDSWVSALEGEGVVEKEPPKMQ